MRISCTRPNRHFKDGHTVTELPAHAAPSRSDARACPALPPCWPGAPVCPLQLSLHATPTASPSSFPSGPGGRRSPGRGVCVSVSGVCVCVSGVCVYVSAVRVSVMCMFCACVHVSLMCVCERMWCAYKWCVCMCVVCMSMCVSVSDVCVLCMCACACT